MLGFGRSMRCAPTPPSAAHYARLLDTAGLALTAIAGHANLLEPDPDAARREPRPHPRRARSGRRPGRSRRSAAGGQHGLRHARDATPTTATALAERFSRAGGARGQHRRVLALEAHVGQAMDQPEKVVWLMQAVNSPHFRLNLDNSHFEVMGRDMDEYLPHAGAVRRPHRPEGPARPLVRAHEFLVPGEGDFDYARYLRALQTAGY